MPTPKLPPHLQTLIDMLPLNVPVHRTDIERQYGATNYARRIRKIVAEYGWDIARHRGTNGANDDWYTRTSTGPVRAAQIRREVPRAKRLEVYARDNHVCKMCGDDALGETAATKPQCDHRVPANRGGPSTEDNLMTLCTRCNLKKRQACMTCEMLLCDECPYAFPELFDETLVLKLPRESALRLRELSRDAGLPPAVLLERLLLNAPAQ